MQLIMNVISISLNQRNKSSRVDGDEAWLVVVKDKFSTSVLNSFEWFDIFQKTWLLDQWAIGEIRSDE